MWRGYYTARNHLLILREYFSVIELLSYTHKQLKYLIAAALYAPDRKKRLKFRLLGIWHGILGVKGKTLDPATLTFLKKSGNGAGVSDQTMITRQKKAVPGEKISVRIPNLSRTSEPLITVITPTYNREKMVQTTIKSVINQTFKNWELIVIDDGSTDNTDAAVEQFLHDPRISYYKKPNTGQPDSLNVAATYANGEFMTFLDSDDEAFPEWLETVARELNQNTGIICNGAVRRLMDGTLIHEEPKETLIFGAKVKNRRANKKA